MSETTRQQGPALPTPEEGVSDVNLSGLDLELMRGAYKADSERMKNALKSGASATCFDVVGRTPLHFAGAHGLRSVAQILLDGGADVNAQDYGGYTALHLATCYMRTDTVGLLLDAGADPNKATYEGAGEGRLAVEIAEELVDAMPERKVFGFEIGKDERQKRLDLYDLLDRVTEVEDDEDDEVELEQAKLQRAAKALEGGDGTTVVVRKKSVEMPKVSVDDAQVKVTVKSKGGDVSSAVVKENGIASDGENKVETSEAVESATPDAAVVKSVSDDTEDAKVTIRTKEPNEETAARKVIDDSEVQVTIRVKGSKH